MRLSKNSSLRNASAIFAGSGEADVIGGSGRLDAAAELRFVVVVPVWAVFLEVTAAAEVLVGAWPMIRCAARRRTMVAWMSPRASKCSRARGALMRLWAIDIWTAPSGHSKSGTLKPAHQGIKFWVIRHHLPSIPHLVIEGPVHEGVNDDGNHGLGEGIGRLNRVGGETVQNRPAGPN